MSGVIPIALVASQPSIVTNIYNILGPKFDVVYVALGTQDALDELPGLCAGYAKALTPGCQLGSNRERGLDDKQSPRIIVFLPPISRNGFSTTMSKVIQTVAPNVVPLNIIEEDLAGVINDNRPIGMRVVRKLEEVASTLD
ncbi:hypothetical protein B0I37DRAFT_356419 [Chaetomium sp. MPI-CAGE-AT-0009]|nr:hypothetical protein B0I37DRAFT_356419 [Chaetomium sp. MPI-CAGE-AT-0009]